MEKILLSDFVKKIGQARVARALGVKPPSIARAIKMGRNIEVTVDDDGACVAYELRPFPSHASECVEAEQATTAQAL